MSQALSQAIHQILDLHPDGLTEREVRWAVIEGLGLRCTPREVREVLHTHPGLFVLLAGGVWRSKAAVEAEKVAANSMICTVRRPLSSTTSFRMTTQMSLRTRPQGGGSMQGATGVAEALPA
ncbi:MAG: hypothetical protein SWK90_06995 [Chloroflexota bacterium]|nr:hypothetical protein [Chloroflexota bacterium]